MVKRVREIKAVVIASVISDRLCIQQDIHKNLSAHNLLSCCDNCCGCHGGHVLNAWKYVKEEGLVTGGSYGSKQGCQPYMIQPCNGKTESFDECGWRSDVVPSCLLSKCTNGTNVKRRFGHKYRIKDYLFLPRVNHTTIMKELLSDGPIQVSMHFYDDLRWHRKGVYMHTMGHFEGDHAVKLIGWDEDKRWLLINSFGEHWGDSGTFLVHQNHEKCNCDFGYAMVAPKLNGTKLTISNAILLEINYKLHTLFVLLNILFLFRPY